MTDQLRLIVRIARNAILNSLIGIVAFFVIVFCTPFWLGKELSNAVKYWWLRVCEEWASATARMGWWK